MNYALVFWGIWLSAILFVENAVWWWATTLIFLTYWSAGALVLVSVIIWILIWFWIKSFMTDSQKKDEDYDF